MYYLGVRQYQINGLEFEQERYPSYHTQGSGEGKKNDENQGSGRERDGAPERNNGKGTEKR